MDFDYIHFYVDDAETWRNWFIQTLDLPLLGTCQTANTDTVAVGYGSICIVLTSPRTTQSRVARYLDRHPPGVADLAFRVTSLSKTVHRAIAAGARLTCSPHATVYKGSALKWAQIQGWGDVRHTLIEHATSPGKRPCLPLCLDDWNTYIPLALQEGATLPYGRQQWFTGIDHAVLNVASGELDQAIAWYETVLGFQRQQSFAIHTDYSALTSQVLVHWQGKAQFPINQPASATSQIQEFLDANGGAGIQHLALQTGNLVETIAALRQNGLAFLPIPPAYYDQLRQRAGFQLSQSEWEAIALQQVLVDWPADNPAARLLQTFTQPVFRQPTFFLELIERQMYYDGCKHEQAKGFGEGNFRALFEAMEREQMKRECFLP